MKNRYGAVNEIGVFAMTDKGLKGVNNPSAMFLSQHGQEVPGSCVLVTQEAPAAAGGNQALVDQAHGNPRPDGRPRCAAAGHVTGSYCTPRHAGFCASIGTFRQMRSAASRSPNRQPIFRC